MYFVNKLNLLNKFLSIAVRDNASKIEQTFTNILREKCL